MQSIQAAVNTTTEFTCWKCGEESLKEAAAGAAPRGPHGEAAVSTDIRHSECGKCGAYAVNAEQARHNKMVGRKVRKERIRESNRSSS
jgi:transcription elongation factor Elf1